MPQRKLPVGRRHGAFLLSCSGALLLLFGLLIAQASELPEQLEPAGSPPGVPMHKQHNGRYESGCYPYREDYRLMEYH